MFVQSHIQRHHHHNHHNHQHPNHHHNHHQQQQQHAAGQHNRHHHAAASSASRGQPASRQKSTADSGPVCELKSSANFRCQPPPPSLDNRPSATCASAVGVGTEDGFHRARSNRAARIVVLANPSSVAHSNSLLSNQRAANVVKQQQPPPQPQTHNVLLMNESMRVARDGLVSGLEGENLAGACEVKHHHQQQQQQAITLAARKRTRSVGSHKSVQVFDFMSREKICLPSGIEPTITTTSHYQTGAHDDHHHHHSRAFAAQVPPARRPPAINRPALVSPARPSDQAEARGSRIRLQRQESISDETTTSSSSSSLHKLLAGSQQLLGKLLQVPHRLATAAESATAATTEGTGNSIQGTNSLQLLGLFCMSLISYQLETWHLLSKDLSKEPMISRRVWVRSQAGQQHPVLVRSATEQVPPGQQQPQQRHHHHQFRLIESQQRFNSHSSELDCNQTFYERPIFEQSETFSNQDGPTSSGGGGGGGKRRDQRSQPAVAVLNHHNHPSYHRHSHSHRHHHHTNHDSPVAGQLRASNNSSARLMTSHSFEHYPAQWNSALSNSDKPNSSRDTHQSAQFARPARDYRLVLCQDGCKSSQATGSSNSNQMGAEFFITGRRQQQQHSFDNHDRAAIQSSCEHRNDSYNLDYSNSNNKSNNNNNGLNEACWIESCRTEFHRRPHDETYRALESFGSHLRPNEIAATNSMNVDNYDSNNIHDAQPSNSHPLGTNRLTTSATKSIKKCSSSSKLSFEGARRRLGLKRKNELQLSSISVNRSEEIMPSEVRHLSRQTTFNSLNDSGTESGSFWCGPSQQQAVVSSDPRIHFVDGLGEGQMASRQALVSPYLGDIQLSLCSRRGMLEIEVIRARHLHPKAGAKSLPSPYVKVYLIKGEKCIAKCKTHQVKQSLDPLYQKAFIFRHEFANCILQAIVWGEYGKRDRKSMMGIVQINLDELDMSNLVIGWYKLFNISSMTSLLASSRILRQKMLHSSSMDESPPRGFD